MICVLSYLSLRVKRSNSVNYARTRLRATLLFTGLPRHLRWLAMTEVSGGVPGDRVGTSS